MCDIYVNYLSKKATLQYWLTKQKIESIRLWSLFSVYGNKIYTVYTIWQLL